MKTLSQDAQNALVFFASTTAQKLEYLNKVRWPASFLLNENGEATKIPLVAITCRFAELIERDIAAHFEVITKRDLTLYHELSSLIELMLTNKDQYEYMWYLDKKAAGVSGFADHLWSVVARLAAKVLNTLDIDASRVQIAVEGLVPSVQPSDIVPIPVRLRPKPKRRPKL